MFKERTKEIENELKEEFSKEHIHQVEEDFKHNAKSAGKYTLVFFKWLLIGISTGLISGVAGCLFHIGIEAATDLRTAQPVLIMFLPLGGLSIAWLYDFFKMKNVNGTDFVIDSIRTDGRVPILMAPAILLSTILTHLFGGSAGREGAALQLGGSLGSQVGKWFRLDEKDMHVAVFCGMSAVFSALFGTPLTAVIFVMEVISVGIIYYSAILPCIVSSVTAYLLSLVAGIKPVRFELNAIPDFEVVSILQTLGLAALCALVSIFFCIVMAKTKHLFAHLFKNSYIRIFVGGILIVLLTILVGSRTYNGAGMNIVDAAILDGKADPAAFILKILFTAITIGCGFKGGEIVPTFFIGATFGCVMGQLLGMDPRFAAAMGLVAMFCGATNTPIASILLSVELFGSKGVEFFAIACGISYMLSGYFSIYSSQKIVYSKLKAVYVNRSTRQ